MMRRIVESGAASARKVLPESARKRIGLISDKVNLLSKRCIEGRIGYRHYKILNAADGNDWIAERLKSGEPAAIGKLGAWETEALSRFLRHRGGVKRLDENGKPYLRDTDGVFPPTVDVFNKFCLVFLEAVKSLDFVAVWYNHGESSIVNKYTNNATLGELYSLVPYYYKNPWSRYLENKRVLLCHPFEASIRRQFLHRDKIWEDKRVLPDFELDTIRVPWPQGMVPTGFKDWFAVLENLKGKMSEKEFDVAIVGAGQYSIPLVAYAKSRGKFAIHLGGDTQILFGIKGKRWEELGLTPKFYNNYWCRPTQEETPPNTQVFDGGCYW